MQIVIDRAIEVDPALDRLAYSRSHGNSERGRTICWDHYAGGDSDPIIARSDSSGVPDKRHSVAEGTRSEFQLRDRERLVTAGWIVQCDRNRSRMTNGDTAETRRGRIHPGRCICGNGEVLATCALCGRTDVMCARDGIRDHQIGAVHERRLNLRRRPGGVEVQEHCRRPGNVWR